MKTNYKFIAAFALAGVLAFSCGKDDVKAPVEPEEKPDTPVVVDDGLVPVTFSADILLSRAALGEDGKTVTWESTDHIAVYDGTARRDFSVKSLGEDGRTAVFEGSVAEDATEFYAVYPYSAASETLPTAEGVISLTYPAEQTVSASGIASGALVCVAKADENKALAFKNVSSLLKIHIPGGDVTSVTVKGNNSEKFAGATTTAVAADAAAGDASGITLLPSGTTFAEGDYWFGLLPVTFENGFTLTYEKEGAKAFVKTDKSAGFERNAGLDVTTSTASVDWIGLPIMTESDLRNFAAYTRFFDATQTVHLGADINLTSPWTPFNLYCQFDGKYNGVTHKITGLDVSVNSASATRAGFVYELYPDASIMNMDVSGNITLTGTANALYFVGLIAEAKGSVVNVVNRATVSLASDATCPAYIGGVVGRLNAGGNISSSDNYGSVSLNGTSQAASFVGGIAGYMTSTAGNVESCTNYGTVSCNNTNGQGIGGIAGMMQGAKVSGCTNDAPIVITASTSGNSFAGGIVGYEQNRSGAKAEISSCTNTSNGIINFLCYNPMGVGGIVGLVHGYTNGANEISGCKNLADITADYRVNTTNDGTVTGVAGILGEMQGSVTVNNNVNRGSVSVFNNSKSSAAGGIVGRVRSALTFSGNYNFGDISFTKRTLSTSKNDDGCCGGFVGMFIPGDNNSSKPNQIGYAEVTCDLVNSRNLGKIAGAGRAGGVFASATYNCYKLTINLTGCKVGGPMKGFFGNKFYEDYQTPSESNYSSFIYSYYKAGTGNTTLTQTGSGYISAADAEAELAAH